MTIINAALRLKASNMQDGAEVAKKRFVASFVFAVTEGNKSYLDAFESLLSKSYFGPNVVKELEKRCVDAANKVMFSFIEHHSYDKFLDKL